MYYSRARDESSQSFVSSAGRDPHLFGMQELGGRSISNLKLGSIGLFGQYSDINTDSENDQETFATEEPDPESESYVLRRKGKGPSRNRPRNEVSEVRKATLDPNIPNDALVGKGGLRCFRCGRDDHVVRGCPLPFT